MSSRSARPRLVVPTALALIAGAGLVDVAAQAGHGGGGHSGGHAHHSGGRVGRPPGTRVVGHGGGGRIPAIPSGGLPWDQPVLDPDRLPEARLARFVDHLVHPHR